MFCEKDNRGRSQVYSLMDVGSVRRSDNLYKKTSRRRLWRGPSNRMTGRRSIVLPRTPVFPGGEAESEQAYGQILNDLFGASDRPASMTTLY